MKDLFQCVMNSQQFFDFYVDVSFSYRKADGLVVVTGHRQVGPFFWGGGPSWENFPINEELM